MSEATYTKTFPVSWQELHRDAKALAWRLHGLRPWRGVVAITRGGLVPAAIVARELDLRVIDTDVLPLMEAATTGDAKADKPEAKPKAEAKPKTDAKTEAKMKEFEKRMSESATQPPATVPPQDRSQVKSPGEVPDGAVGRRAPAQGVLAVERGPSRVGARAGGAVHER